MLGGRPQYNDFQHLERSGAAQHTDVQHFNRGGLLQADVAAFASPSVPAALGSQANVTPLPGPTAAGSFGRSTTYPLTELDQATGLLGMFAAIADADGASVNSICSSLWKGGVTVPAQLQSITTAHIAEGAALLDLLLQWCPDLDVAVDRRHIGAAGECRANMPTIVTTAVHRSLRAMKGSSQADLYAISRAIFDRTSLPLELPAAATNKAIEKALTGDGLRWESVGLYCAQIGLLFGERVESYPNESNRNVLMQRAFLAFLQCESLCNRLGQVNDLTLWSIESAITLATWCFGDNALSVWQLVGKISEIVYALGYHTGIRDDPKVPRYLRELRKRALWEGYGTDVELSTFVGRPPRLSRRYLAMTLPLDLPDSLIVGPSDALEAAVLTLDERGWRGIEIAPCQTTYVRVRCFLNTCREDTLELILGPEHSDSILQAQ
jgi:hypothetical protein